MANGTLDSQGIFGGSGIRAVVGKKNATKCGLLVVVDFSEHPKAALEFAAEQAACMGVPLDVLHKGSVLI